MRARIGWIAVIAAGIGMFFAGYGFSISYPFVSKNGLTTNYFYIEVYQNGVKVPVKKDTATLKRDEFMLKVIYPSKPVELTVNYSISNLFYNGLKAKKSLTEIYKNPQFFTLHEEDPTNPDFWIVLDEYHYTRYYYINDAECSFDGATNIGSALICQRRISQYSDFDESLTRTKHPMGGFEAKTIYALFCYRKAGANGSYRELQTVRIKFAFK